MPQQQPSKVFPHAAVNAGEWFAFDLPVVSGERGIWVARVVSGPATVLKDEFFKATKKPTKFGDPVTQRITLRADAAGEVVVQLDKKTSYWHGKVVETQRQTVLVR